MARHVEREGAFAEARTGGEYDEVGALQPAAEQLVELGEARYDRRERDGGRVLHRARMLHVAVHEVADVGEVARDAPGADVVERFLRAA